VWWNLQLSLLRMLGGADGIRTRDLQIMSLASYHCSTAHKQRARKRTRGNQVDLGSIVARELAVAFPRTATGTYHRTSDSYSLTLPLFWVASIQ